jgi:hypothetical protein
MNNRAIIVAAVLMAAALTGIFTTSLAYADESETSTDQENKQKNIGSGNSFNNNCAENIDPPPPPGQQPSFCTGNNQPNAHTSPGG